MKYNNHYEYLDVNLNDFWIKVFGKSLEETWCAGIVDAHGDKGYCYRSAWKDAGIHFYHGMMLYMLTYTDVMDLPKYESCKWVVENYPKYKSLLAPIG